jgi:hypothetical protein
MESASDRLPKAGAFAACAAAKTLGMSAAEIVSV